MVTWKAGQLSYRVEFNIWGTGTAHLKDSPFSASGGPGETNETSFNKTLEVTFTVVSTTSDGTGVYTPNIQCRSWLG